VWRPTGRVLRRWRRRDRGRLLFVRGDGTRLPVDDESVDGVSLFFVLHHIPYDGQSRVIDEATRVMKPGGRLFLLEDTPENKIEWEITVRRDRRLNFEGADEEHYYRSGDEWRQMLTEKGLVVEKEVYFEENGRAADNGTTRHRCFILRRARERERERQRDRDRDRDRARAQERD
jgi:SAM-dependent methyltransferase